MAARARRADGPAEPPGLDRGRLAGPCEDDVEAGAVVWAASGSASGRPAAALREALEAAVQRTEAFVRAELGDARSFSLDSPASRAPRIAALRKAG